MKEKLEVILNKMNEIEYGYIFNNKDIYPEDDEWDKSFQNFYKLQIKNELLKNKKGVCWDQVELERYYLENENIKCESYFIIGYDDLIFPTHTFIVIPNKEKYYWLEHSWEPNKGIWEFEKLEELLLHIKNKFMISYKLKEEDVVIYKYEKPLENYNCKEFMNYCEKGIKIEI